MRGMIELGVDQFEESEIYTEDGLFRFVVEDDGLRAAWVNQEEGFLVGAWDTETGEPELENEYDSLEDAATQFSLLLDTMNSDN